MAEGIVVDGEEIPEMGDDGEDGDGEGQQKKPKAVKFKSLGTDKGKSSMSHMSSARNHLNNLLRITGEKYKTYISIPTLEIVAVLANAIFFGAFVRYLLEHVDASLKPKKKKMKLSSVSNNVTG